MSALGDARFRRLLIGNSVSSFGDSALYLSLGIWAKDLTGSNAAAGAIFLARACRAWPRRWLVSSPTGSGGGRFSSPPTRRPARPSLPW